MQTLLQNYSKVFSIWSTVLYFGVPKFGVTNPNHFGVPFWNILEYPNQIWSTQIIWSNLLFGVTTPNRLILLHQRQKERREGEKEEGETEKTGKQAKEKEGKKRGGRGVQFHYFWGALLFSITPPGGGGQKHWV